MLTTLDLFAGIGGFARGLEATGSFETTCFVENEPYCQAVLRHHWPDVPVLGDIRDVRRPDLPDPAPDVIVGGFPCQPFSHAGKQRGQDDPRHLWPEMFRLIRECRPTWVVGENVVGIVQLGLDEVLADLESEGYATRTFNIPACAIGAPHIRQRLWVVAHADSESEPDGTFDGNAGQRQLGFGWGEAASHGADPDISGSHKPKEYEPDAEYGEAELRDEQVRESGQVGGDVAHADGSRWDTQSLSRTISPRGKNDSDTDQPGEGRSKRFVADPEGIDGQWSVRQGDRSGRSEAASGDGGEAVADPDSDDGRRGRGPESSGRGPRLEHGGGGECSRSEHHWQFEPDVGRLVDGLPNRVPQLRALGNAIVPQIAQEIGRAIKVAHDGDV